MKTNTMKVGEEILLPTDLTITPHGISCIPYKLTKYEVVKIDTATITLKRGKKIHTKYLNTVKELISAISYNILDKTNTMQTKSIYNQLTPLQNYCEVDKTKLPPVLLYSKYLNIASMRFRLSMDECRNKYGLFTINQWESLLQN